jgi:hypothetical protein
MASSGNYVLLTYTVAYCLSSRTVVYKYLVSSSSREAVYCSLEVIQSGLWPFGKLCNCIAIVLQVA